MRQIARLAAAAFCWMTALYAFLSANAFTYQQLLRPRVFASLGVFSDRHGLLLWIAFAAAVLSVAGELRRGRSGGALAWGFVLCWGAVAAWVAVHPVLPTLVDDHRSMVVGLIALAPLMWLGAIDHVAAGSRLRAKSGGVRRDEVAAAERRLFFASIGAVFFVVALYAVFTPLSIGSAFEPDLLTTGLSIGVLWALADHLLIFCAVFLVAAGVERILEPVDRLAVRYAVQATLILIALAIVLQRMIGDSIGFGGGWGAAGSAALSASLVATWGGLRLRRWNASGTTLGSGYDVFFGPPETDRVGARILVTLAAIGIAAYTLASIAARMDWDFLLLKLSVLLVWIMSFGAIYRATSTTGPVSARTVAVVCLLPLVGHQLDAPLQRALPAWLDAAGYSVRHTLDRYEVYNPTFRLADGVVSGHGTAAPAFDRFVRDHTGVPMPIAPVSIDFVPHLQPATVEPKPFVFLFVVDSLRADYLSPYNPRVTFTPRIDEFAQTSLVFRNAFTRYSGTGLSMSGIWMGAAGPHKQYPQPFAPMNALEKLLDANGYRRAISMDHISAQLLAPSSSTTELDRGIPELDFDFCRTVEELQHEIDAGAADPRPLFAHSRSLNLHVASIMSAPLPVGESYPGFEPRYAARVHRIDGCFGGFLDFLKQRRLYDRSIVILMTDHGEMLGEDGQWGHVYYLFPEVLQIPMLVHLPADAAGSTSIDLDAVAFSTDLTPTLYAALGYRPARDNRLMGRPLIGPDADARGQRRGVEVVAASYGAVWGVLRRNGHNLYIVDANHGRDYHYERPPGGPWRAVPVSPALRDARQREIREYLYEIDRVYHPDGAP